MEAPTPAADGGPRKRPLELGRPEFMATEDGGAYHVLEMPKKHRCGHTAKPSTRRSHLLMSGATSEGTTSSREETTKEKKRALELDKPEFVAEEEGDGAYDIREMPKKYKFESMDDPEISPFGSALDAEHARWLASMFRVLSVCDKHIRERKAMAAASLN